MAEESSVTVREPVACMFSVLYSVGLALLCCALWLGDWWAFQIQGQLGDDHVPEAWAGENVQFTVVVYKGLFRTCAGGCVKGGGEYGQTISYSDICGPLDITFHPNSTGAIAKYFTVSRICSVIALVFALLPAACIPFMMIPERMNTGCGQLAPCLASMFLLIAVLFHTTVVIIAGELPLDAFDARTHAVFRSAMPRIITGRMAQDGFRVDVKTGSDYTDSESFAFIMAGAASIVLFFAALCATYVVRRTRHKRRTDYRVPQDPGSRSPSIATTSTMMLFQSDASRTG